VNIFSILAEPKSNGMVQRPDAPYKHLILLSKFDLRFDDLATTCRAGNFLQHYIWLISSWHLTAGTAKAIRVSTTRTALRFK